MNNFILIHYSEIYLKGKNRPFFEKKLVDNINSALSRFSSHKPAKLIFDRIIIELKDDINKEKYKERLKKVPGIANFSFCRNTQQDLEEIKKTSWKVIKNKNFNTFAVRTNRVNKDFNPDSQTTSTKVGAYVVNKLKEKKRKSNVDLEDPDQTVFIEIVESFAFVYSKKIQGAGGLPTSTTGEVMSLISTGIDSPVAAWKMMRRGCKVSFCHFHSFPFTNKKTKINVERIVKKLVPWQLEADLYFVNLNDIQKEIIKKIDSKYRLLFYRREMFRLAERVAKENDITGLVTGESVGQVASQTLENMHSSTEATSLPIYRPNISSHKQEIIDKAKELKTYEISTEDVEDCCSYMIADHPQTKANLDKILELDQNLDLEEKREKALEQLEYKYID